MKGLFEKCFKHFDIIKKGAVIVNQSSIYTSDYHKASDLLYRIEGYVWASDNIPNSWIEIYYTKEGRCTSFEKRRINNPFVKCMVITK